MVRKAHTKPVTPQMYRHFAAVTLAATLMMALFSNGDSREAVAHEVATRAAPPPKLQRRDGKPPVRHDDGGSDGFDAEYGLPMDRFGATPQGTSLAFGDERRRTGFPAGFTQYGVSSEVWATLTPDQQKALMAKRKAELDSAATPERKRQIDALMAASRARSGASGTAAD
jgi:hypothetical protein